MFERKTKTPSPLLRTSPDPLARSATSPRLFALATYYADIVVLFFLPIYIPYLVLTHLLSPRPYPSWTLSKLLRTRINKLRVHVLQGWLPPPETVASSFAIPKDAVAYHEAKRTGEMGVDVVSIPPVGHEYRVGMGECARIKAVERPGFMLSPRAAVGNGLGKAVMGEKVILHIHGGGYIRGHPLWTPFALEIAKTTGLRVFTINYRKCVIAANAFPAPLLDAIAGYLYLTQTLNFPPSDIAVLGESAGGHLSLALTRYLSDLSLPLPGFMILCSPWADFTFSYPSYSLNEWYDTLHYGRLGHAVRSATRYYTPEAVRGPYFSPALAEPQQWAYLEEAETRVYLVVGTRECFADEIYALAEGIEGAGVDVLLREDVDGVHTGAIGDPAAKKVFLKDVRGILGLL